MRIGIVAPSTPFTRDDAQRVAAIAAAHHPVVELVFDDQCFAEASHFAGPDAARREALVEMANRDDIDAVWFARGGYGASRIAADAVAAMAPAARRKSWLGYSDQGNILGALYRAGFDNVAHGPMPADIRRFGGEAAVLRALDWLVARDAAALDPAVAGGRKHAAFNLMTLSMMIGTPWMPDLTGHILMVEEVSEYDYAFDRAMGHVTSALAGVGLAGLRLGRVSDIIENDRPFGMDAVQSAQSWCEKTGIAWLGRADIGHDADNKVVPFGLHA